MIRDRSKRLRALGVKLIGAAGLLIVWSAASRLEHSPIILPTPLDTIVSLIRLLGTPAFWLSVAFTVVRGLLGFVISFACGLVVGVAAGVSETLRHALAPLLTVLRATPVMSVILLALIWFASGWVPVFVAFLMVFPIVCGNVTEGIRSTDPHLLAMSRVYRVPRARMLTSLYLPSVVPYVTAAISVSLGITWKVVVAAEVLSQPLHAIGTGMQFAKYRLDTAEVFAWTAIAVVLSALSEGIFGFAERRIAWRHGTVGH